MPGLYNGVFRSSQSSTHICGKAFLSTGNVDLKADISRVLITLFELDKISEE